LRRRGRPPSRVSPSIPRRESCRRRGAKHYALRIVPAATHERFEGRAQIEIEVARPVAAIELNAVDLDFDAARLHSAAGSTLLAATFDRSRETVALAPAAGPIAAGATA